MRGRFSPCCCSGGALASYPGSAEIRELPCQARMIYLTNISIQLQWMLSQAVEGCSLQEADPTFPPHFSLSLSLSVLFHTTIPPYSVFLTHPSLLNSRVFFFDDSFPRVEKSKRA